MTEMPQQIHIAPPGHAVDILIPTYNRAAFLRKNIALLDRQIAQAGLRDYYRIIISDNHSTDGTAQILEEARTATAARLLVFRQDRNVGLEENAVFLLRQSDAGHIIYLGDDDYLPDGYLAFIADTLSREGDVSCIVPGYSGLHPDGTLTPARDASFGIRKYRPGLRSVMALSSFGHQLSGIVTRRQGLLENYLRDGTKRNLYPFIYFLACCALTGTGYYAPRYQVTVTLGNAHHWSYDGSNLLGDALVNYRILYPRSPARRLLLSLAFVGKQPWRMSVGRNPKRTAAVVRDLIQSKNIDLLFKLSFVAVLPYCYARQWRIARDKKSAPRAQAQG